MADADPLAISLLSEIFSIDQLARGKIGRALPKGMELSHFAVMNLLAHVEEERAPADLARVFNVTRGAMTNTLKKLEQAGYVHIRPDWDDARRKFVSLSPAGKKARSAALADLDPILEQVTERMGHERLRESLPVLREIRLLLAE